VTQDAEYGDQLAATEAVEKAWKKARETYSDALALARIAFKNNLDAQRTLRLNGVRRESLSGWLEDAKVFYQQLLDNPAWVQALERYDYSVDRLTQEGGRGPGQTVGRGQRVVQRPEGSGEGGFSERPAETGEVGVGGAEPAEDEEVGAVESPRGLLFGFCVRCPEGRRRRVLLRSKKPKARAGAQRGPTPRPKQGRRRLGIGADQGKLRKASGGMGEGG